PWTEPVSLRGESLLRLNSYPDLVRHTRPGPLFFVHFPCADPRSRRYERSSCRSCRGTGKGADNRSESVARPDQAPGRTCLRASRRLPLANFVALAINVDKAIPHASADQRDALVDGALRLPYFVLIATLSPPAHQQKARPVRRNKQRHLGHDDPPRHRLREPSAQRSHAGEHQQQL